MSQATEVYQTTGDHRGYSVDWSDWLASKGYTVDDIVSVTWVVTPDSTLVKTTQALTGAVAKVWFKGAVAKKRYHVVCQLALPIPTGAADNVIEEFHFDIIGKAS